MFNLPTFKEFVVHQIKYVQQVELLKRLNKNFKNLLDSEKKFNDALLKFQTKYHIPQEFLDASNPSTLARLFENHDNHFSNWDPKEVENAKKSLNYLIDLTYTRFSSRLLVEDLMARVATIADLSYGYDMFNVQDLKNIVKLFIKAIDLSNLVYPERITDISAIINQANELDRIPKQIQMNSYKDLATKLDKIFADMIDARVELAHPFEDKNYYGHMLCFDEATNILTEFKDVIDSNNGKSVIFGLMLVHFVDICSEEFGSDASKWSFLSQNKFKYLSKLMLQVVDHGFGGKLLTPEVKDKFCDVFYSGEFSSYCESRITLDDNEILHNAGNNHAEEL